MDNIGFIGYGSMGSMLVGGLLRSGKVDQDHIIVTRKNKEKLAEITKDWPQIRLAEDAIEVVKQADIIFICVKPAEYISVLVEIKPAVTSKHHIISISAAVKISDIEDILPCKITKILPTIISEIKEGITLICHNNRVSDEDIIKIENLLKDFTHLKKLNEDDFGFASEFTSCGPGLFAAMLQEFTKAGLRISESISKEEVMELVLLTVYGTAGLMLQMDMNFNDVVSRVATKGGITEEGVNIIQAGLPQVFDEVFAKTMEKREAVDEKVHIQFRNRLY